MKKIIIAVLLLMSVLTGQVLCDFSYESIDISPESPIGGGDPVNITVWGWGDNCDSYPNVITSNVVGNDIFIELSGGETYPIWECICVDPPCPSPWLWSRTTNVGQLDEGTYTVYVSGDITGQDSFEVGRSGTHHVDDVNGNDLNNGFHYETAFKTIQKGINEAQNDETILVWPGTYNEEIDFLGKAITVKAADDAPVLKAPTGYAVSFYSSEGLNSLLKNFVITNSDYAIYLDNVSSPTIENLTITDCNYGIWAYNGSDPNIKNCLFYDNTNDDLFQCTAEYSWVEDSNSPQFVDSNNDDYHLLSERGRYWPQNDIWVLDDITSPCIDAGDPNDDPSAERSPHGGRINLGAFGGTPHASMSECPEHDSNCDRVLDYSDMSSLADTWLDTGP